MKLDNLKIWIASIGHNSLARNTLWMLLAQGIRLFLQAFYFVIIARVLGVEQYGAFVLATSLVAILSPFSGLGVGNILIKNVSKNRALFSYYWGNALFMISVSKLIRLVEKVFVVFSLLIFSQAILPVINQVRGLKLDETDLVAQVLFLMIRGGIIFLTAALYKKSFSSCY